MACSAVFGWMLHVCVYVCHISRVSCEASVHFIWWYARVVTVGELAIRVATYVLVCMCVSGVCVCVCVCVCMSK